MNLNTVLMFLLELSFLIIEETQNTQRFLNVVSTSIERSDVTMTSIERSDVTMTSVERSDVETVSCAGKEYRSEYKLYKIWINKY